MRRVKKQGRLLLVAPIFLNADFFLNKILPILCVSGTCALVYQIAWMRELRLIFGGTTAANGAVLAIFMGGLGLGNVVFGRLADRSLNPMRFYALMELTIAISAAMTPFLIHGAESLYVMIGGQEAIGWAGATIVRLCLTAMVLAVPTIFMGGTLPAAARSFVAANDQQRRGVGLLYGVNTLGAVLGPIVCAFFLLEWLGTTQTIWLAAATNFTVAMAALMLSRDASSSIGVETETVPSMPTTTVERSSASAPVHVYASSAVLGFAFLTMEIVWYRLLGPILGGSTYTFAVILSLALAGMGIGSAAYLPITRRLKPSVNLFAMTCSLEALCMAVPFALGDRIAILASELSQLYRESFLGMVLVWYIVAAILILPVALVSGFQFPLLVSLVGQGRQKIGKQVGAVFGFNTLGAIIGSLLAGFVIMPSLGAVHSWRAVVILLVIVSVYNIVVGRRDNKANEPLPATADNSQKRNIVKRRRVPASDGIGSSGMFGTKHFQNAACGLFAFASLYCLASTGPTGYWRHGGIGAGRGAIVDENIGAYINRINREILWETEGIEASVAVLNSGDDGLQFRVNGKSDGSAVFDAATQVMLGNIGGVLHRSPKSGLIIGLGTGESAGWLAQIPSIETVTVIEIEPKIREVAIQCQVANNDVLNNPKVTVLYNDAREHLRTTRHSFDLIVSEPSNLYRIGVTNLFTTEFYQSVKQRMSEGGHFVQWLQGYEIDNDSLAMVLTTLRGVFPHVEVWSGAACDLMLICSSEPIFDVSTVRQNLSQEEITRGVRSVWRDDTIEGVLGHYICGLATVDEFIRRYPTEPVSDDRNSLEYSIARSVAQITESSAHALRRVAMQIEDTHPSNDSKVDWELVEDQWNYWHGPVGDVELTSDRRTRLEAIQAYPRDPARVVELWNLQPRPPRLAVELSVLAHCYAILGNPLATQYVESLRRYDPLSADLILAEYYILKGVLPLGTKLLMSRLPELKHSPWVDKTVLSDVLVLIRMVCQNEPKHLEFFRQGLQVPFAAYLLDDQRLETLQFLQ